MPLTMLNIGETGKIKRIGGNEETRRFLNNLGFVVGTEVSVVSAIGGNVIVNIKDSRVAINEDMAKRWREVSWCRKGGSVVKLNEVEVGSTVTVKKIEGDGAYKRRIMDMGITKGVELYIRKVAPLGDPVEITVRGYELSVRKNDAQCVEVE